MQEPLTWHIEFSNRLADLMQAIAELDRTLQAWGADSNARYVAQLAIEELGTNAIKYGFDDPGEHLICLTAKSEERAFRLSLEDDGHEFNPCSVPEPDPARTLQERAPGGWGLALVRRLAAGLEYERRGNRNIVSVIVLRQKITP